MAWTPRITVDCDKAKSWGWCPKFKAQVEEAERAITAQFQAFTCVDLHFCNETESLYEWIENHSFGNQYPQHHLPIPGCVHESASEQQSQLLCKACERVVDVSIERGQCLPQFKTLQPGSLQERCLYLADVIGNKKEMLLQEFKQRVCSCLGCCGDGSCFYRNREENWMQNLIESVQNKVVSQLELEGWVSIHKTGQPKGNF